VLIICVAADHPELDAQVSAASAACAEARLQVVYWRRWALQDVRIHWDSLHRRHRLSEPTGTHCRHVSSPYTHPRSRRVGEESGVEPMLFWTNTFI